LLNHTSGLPDYQQVMDQYWDKTQAASNKEIIEYLNRYAPARSFEPGEKYEYSNTGYVLLASIAEKVSGNDFIALCRKWIFEPLKMTSTNIRTLEEKASTPAFALGHVYSAEQNAFLHASRFRSSDYTFWLGNRKGPGRISSNAADLLRWDEALYRNRLVNAATLQQAFTPGRLNNGDTISYGFGWMLGSNRENSEIVFHTGDNPGYQTKIVRFLKKKRTLILLCNNDYKQFHQLCEKLESILSTQ
jgi:CubicO group peptidase (beta-lactamase class C family)